MEQGVMTSEWRCRGSQRVDRCGCGGWLCAGTRPLTVNTILARPVAHSMAISLCRASHPSALAPVRHGPARGLVGSSAPVAAAHILS